MRFLCIYCMYLISGMARRLQWYISGTATCHKTTRLRRYICQILFIVVFASNYVKEEYLQCGNIFKWINEKVQSKGWEYHSRLLQESNCVISLYFQFTFPNAFYVRMFFLIGLAKSSANRALPGGEMSWYWNSPGWNKEGPTGSFPAWSSWKIFPWPIASSGANQSNICRPVHAWHGTKTKKTLYINRVNT